MWNNAFFIRLKWLFSDAGFRRLVFALGLSLLLHFFIIGKFYFNLPKLEQKSQVIVATIIVHQPPPKPAIVSQSVAENPKPLDAPKVEKQQKIIKPKTIPAEELPAENPLTENRIIENETVAGLTTPNLASQDIANTTETEVEKTAEPENVDTSIEAQVEENPIEVNLNAYLKVDAEFDVYTESDPALSHSPAGSARMAFEREPNDSTYQIKSLIQARGLAALVVPDLLQTSTGDVDNAGLKPRHYLYQFGNRKNKTYSADFDWQANQLNLHNVNGSQARVLANGTQDLLSFMYQFMFVPPLQNMQLSITNGKKVGVYDYTFEGEEVISTKMGNLNTVHLLRSSAEKEKTTELWLALDYQYVPVKIRETEKDGKVYVLLVKALKTQ